jgi:hypothetical protein
VFVKLFSAKNRPRRTLNSPHFLRQLGVIRKGGLPVKPFDTFFHPRHRSRPFLAKNKTKKFEKCSKFFCAG